MYSYNVYMAFGLSGNQHRTKMIGGDVTIAWVDRGTGQPHAIDYYLESRHQVLEINVMIIITHMTCMYVCTFYSKSSVFIATKRKEKEIQSSLFINFSEGK